MSLPGGYLIKTLSATSYVGKIIKMSKKYNKEIIKQLGFTLVELMVAISIFSLVMVISMGAILSVLDANHKSQTLRAVMDNLNSTMESMTRSVRFGQHYHCTPSDLSGSTDLSAPQDCSSGGHSLTVLDYTNHLVTYSLSNGQISRSLDLGTPILLTSPDVTIQNLSFYVLGSCPTTGGLCSDTTQARVVMVIRGIVNGQNSASSSFTIETTVSQRKLDI